VSAVASRRAEAQRLEAHEPPEARGLRRDQVRLMVASGDGCLLDARFDELPRLLEAGDLLVVNTSATLAAAVPAVAPDGSHLVVHFSGPLPRAGGENLWLVELRDHCGAATRPSGGGAVGDVLTAGDGALELLGRYVSRSRLWVALLAFPVSPVEFLARHGRPIRYGYVERDWPLAAYQTVFADEPGSAEMPSAGRPFTPEVLAALGEREVDVAPLVLHTGVSSLEHHEPPYPERFRVPAETARRVNATRRAGGRVIAVGTTVVRALETVAAPGGEVSAGSGWTDLVVTPERGVRAVDGLLTGWHEREASHLLMLEAVAGRGPVERSYRAAAERGYLWHEFGDVELLLRGTRPRQVSGSGGCSR
jgi:S-adenosylmethionine:tRNA ribosyltransferase-isomerase